MGDKSIGSTRFKFLCYIVVAMFIAVLLLNPAFSQSYNQNPRTRLKNLNYGEVLPIISGFADSKNYTLAIHPARESRQPTIEIQNHRNEIQFHVRSVACDSGQCLGLVLYQVFAAPVSIDAIREFNHRYPFFKVHELPQGGALASRYLVADYGALHGNVFRNIVNFDTILGEFNSRLDDWSQQQPPTDFESQGTQGDSHRINHLKYEDLEIEKILNNLKSNITDGDVNINHD